MSLNNLSLIGHIGNFVVETDGKDKTPNESPHKISLYDNPFEFSGTGEILQGSLNESAISDVGASITGAMEGSHNVKILTFGLDSIYSVGQSGGLLPNLESLSLMKYVDLSAMVSGLKLPSLLSLPGKKGKGR